MRGPPARNTPMHRNTRMGSALDAAEDDGHALAGVGRGAVGRQEAGEAGGAGGAHRDAGRDAELVGPRRSPPPARRAAGRRSARRRRGRRASRRSRRRGSRRRPSAGRPTASSPLGQRRGRASADRPAPAPGPAARSPRSARRRGGRRRRGPIRCTSPARRRRPGRRRGRARRVGHLPPDRAATVEAQGVLRSLHAERHGAGGDGLPEPQHGRVARRVVRRRRGHGWMRAPSDSSSPSTSAPAHVGTNTSSGHSARWASVAAAIAALPHEAMASGGRARSTSPSDSAATRWSRIVTRWRPLWLPPTLPVSSFTHTFAPIALDTSGECANGVTVNPSASVRVRATHAASVIPWVRANAHHARRGP